MHWADVIASKLLKTGGKHRIATGITPSGHIHVGNMREILTGDLVYRAAADAGVDVTLYYIADDFDPLRKVYPFLPNTYEEHIGKPLSEIPSPDGEGTYSEYFLTPFLGSLARMGIEPEVVRGSISYRKGRYYESIKTIMDNVPRVKEILEKISGRQLKKSWMPYNPKCSGCGRIGTSTPSVWEDPYVSYTCECGHEGKADTRTDDGKLPWRLDWPARWNWLGVTCEPFGKDHAASGGSYDTSSAIIRELFSSEPPIPVVYEWIQLKGKGAMSSSSGVVISGTDMLNMTPPEVLRYMIARNQPNRHLDMDPGMGILSLVDSYDKLEEGYGKGDDQDQERIFELSMVDPGNKEGSRPPIHIPYRHLVTLVQMTQDMGSLAEKIKLAEGLEDIDEISMGTIDERRTRIMFWLERFAPENVKFHLCDEAPDDVVNGLEEGHLKALSAMREEFATCDWDAETLHNVIYDGSRSREIDPRDTFTAFYRILLGKEKGPRLGYFLHTMERDDVLKRLGSVLSRRM
ncbi:MAG: lysine--tRNA ligase [Thermoplasmata archaeon]|nr:lysine--tRNA ligase [Thermoplasmata archaeon]